MNHKSPNTLHHYFAPHQSRVPQAQNLASNSSDTLASVFAIIDPPYEDAQRSECILMHHIDSIACDLNITPAGALGHRLSQCDDDY